LLPKQVSSKFSSHLIIQFFAWNFMTFLNLRHKVLLKFLPDQLNLHSLNPLPLNHFLPFSMPSITRFLLKFWLFKPNNNLCWTLSLHYSTTNLYLWSILWIYNWRWNLLKSNKRKYWISSRPIFHYLLLPDPTFDAHGIGFVFVLLHIFWVLASFCIFVCYDSFGFLL